MSAEPETSERPATIAERSSFGRELRHQYTAVREQKAAPGPVTVLHIGADETGIAVGVAAGINSEPVSTMTVALGSVRTARDHFRQVLPDAQELENAIQAVEDEIMRMRTLIPGESTLWSGDPVIREIAVFAGVEPDGGLPVSLEAVEQSFDRLASVSLGRPAAAERIPASGSFAATLLILREFMHHMRFPSIRLVDAPLQQARPVRRA